MHGVRSRLGGTKDRIKSARLKPRTPLVPAMLRHGCEQRAHQHRCQKGDDHSRRTILAISVPDADDKAHWVEAGRCYERFALQSAALGIRRRAGSRATVARTEF